MKERIAEIGKKGQYLGDALMTKAIEILEKSDAFGKFFVLGSLDAFVIFDKL